MGSDYIYDCEGPDFIVYRNKYTGKEIHVSKNTEDIIAVPKNATNKDVINALFPAIEIAEKAFLLDHIIELKNKDCLIATFNDNEGYFAAWLNARYRGNNVVEEIRDMVLPIKEEE